MPRTAPVLVLTTLAVVALAAPAAASHGGGGTTPPATAGPCLKLTALNSGLELRGGTKALEFSARSCSSSRQTVTTAVTDTSRRVLYPGVSCGDAAYAGPALALAPGASVTVTLPVRHGTCYPASAEAHDVSLTAVGPGGVALSTAWASWADRPRTESA